MTKSDKNPFLSAITAEANERKIAEARLPKGMKLVTLAEAGCHLPASETFQKSRKIALKFTNTPEGHAAWEKQAMKTHETVEADGGAILVLTMQGHSIGSESHRKRLQGWREGKLQLPALGDYLGMKPLTPAGTAPRAAVQRRETNEELESRLARQRREKAEGVRLERPGVIRVER